MLSRRFFLGYATLLAATLVVSDTGFASENLPVPTGTEILRITGKIDRKNQGDAAVFDREMLNNLPQQRLETYTDWTEGVQVFEGPPLADVLEAVRANGTKIRAFAINDYSAIMPLSDAKEYSVLLALRHNGEAMSVRKNGPIWIIYPKLGADTSEPSPHNEKSVWQLNRLNIE